MKIVELKNTIAEIKISMVALDSDTESRSDRRWN